MEISQNIVLCRETPFLFCLGPKFIMVIDKPEDIEIVLNSKNCMEKGDLYKFLNRGVSLFAAPGKLINFFFNFP